MFRTVICVAACALPLVISSSAGAQSYVSLSGESEVASRAPLGPPKSITQRYVPRSTSPVGELALLIDEAAPGATPAPAAGISVTSAQPIARTAAHDLGIGRPVIVVSNVKGVGRE
jgi:hypothetical protein